MGLEFIFLSTLRMVSLLIGVSSSTRDFSSSSFRFSDLTLRFFINLELIFVQGDKFGSIFTLLRVDILLVQHHLWKEDAFIFT